MQSAALIASLSVFVISFSASFDVSGRITFLHYTNLSNPSPIALGVKTLIKPPCFTSPNLPSISVRELNVE